MATAEVMLCEAVAVDDEVTLQAPGLAFAAGVATTVAGLLM